MHIVETELPGLVVVEPCVFEDERGFFFEAWNADRHADAGLDVAFVQDNVSSSSRGVLRGLHFQHPHGQAKLVSVLAGEIFDVAVDVRRGSPTFGKWSGILLSSGNHRQLLIPGGFAHGFLVTSESALVSYKASDFYDPACERTIGWDDVDLAIAWPSTQPLLSPKDANGMRLRDMPPEWLPAYDPAA